MEHNDDRVKYTELDNNNAHNIVSAISKIYFIFYEVDLEKDSFDKYYASKMVSDVTDKYSCAHDALKDIGKNLFVYEDTNNMEEFFDTMTWPARLNHKDTIYFDAKGKYTGWVRCNLIVSSRNEKGVPIKVIAAVQDINEEKKKEIRRIKKLGEITSVYDTLIDQSEIVSSAGLGIWHIIISDKHEPRMQVSDKMAELLGIDVSKLTEEEVYSSWYDNVLPEAIESVQKSVQEMMDGNF